MESILYFTTTDYYFRYKFSSLQWNNDSPGSPILNVSCSKNWRSESTIFFFGLFAPAICIHYIKPTELITISHSNCGDYTRLLKEVHRFRTVSYNLCPFFLSPCIWRKKRILVDKIVLIERRIVGIKQAPTSKHDDDESDDHDSKWGDTWRAFLSRRLFRFRRGWRFYFDMRRDVLHDWLMQQRLVLQAIDSNNWLRSVATRA